MGSIRFAIVVSLLTCVLNQPTTAQEAAPEKPAVAAAVCVHGVKPVLCTRCNPKLEPVFKAKGDWCAEHTRPESQCVLCHPELAQQGVK